MSIFDFASIKNTAQRVADNIAQRRAQAEALRGQMQAVRAAPVARSELKAALEAWVDESALAFTKSVRCDIAGVLSKPHSARSLQLELASTLSLVRQQAMEARGSGAAHRPLDAALCALFGPQVKKALLASIDDLPDGLTTEERDRELRRIDAQLTQLNTEIQQLLSEAQEAGLKLPS